jgi:hypothetical protein
MYTPNPSKKLDMGKGCVRFKSFEELALDVVHRCAHCRGGAHGQLPSGKSALGLGKEGRQKVCGEEGDTKK